MLGKKVTAQVAPSNFKPMQMSTVSTKSLVLYGEPKTGKTAVVKSLVEAGLEIYYLDLDSNVESIMSVASAPNFHYYPVKDNNGSGFLFFQRLRKEGLAHLCHAHGLAQCNECAQAEAPFAELNVTAMPKGSVLVVDSFTSLYKTVVSAVATYNAIEPLQVSEDNSMPYFKALSASSEPIWHFLNKLPAPAHTLIITHGHDQQNMLNADKVSSFVYPVCGSGSFSLKDSSRVYPSAIWRTKKARGEDAIKNAPAVLQSDLVGYAASPSNTLHLANLPIGEAAVKFFQGT